MLSLLSRLAPSRRRAGAARPAVTVYSRAQCCCCHNALDLLKRYRRRYRLDVREVDVDSDPALAERFGQSVPVVEINGKVRFRGVVNPVLLDRLLAAEARNG